MMERATNNQRLLHTQRIGMGLQPVAAVVASVPNPRSVQRGFSFGYYFYFWFTTSPFCAGRPLTAG
jgi:hypothetical protein